MARGCRGCVCRPYTYEQVEAEMLTEMRRRQDVLAPDGAPVIEIGDLHFLDPVGNISGMQRRTGPPRYSLL